MEVLPLTLSASATHYLYLRKHQAQSGASLPEDRTLFIANLPIDCSERQLAHFFKAHNCGTVERVVFGGSHANDAVLEAVEDADGSEMNEDETPVASSSRIVPLPSLSTPLRPAGHTAHIVFLDESSVASALALSSTTSSKKRIRWPPTPSSEPTGLQRLLSRYDALHPQLSLSRDHSDTFITAYEARVEASKLAALQNSKYKKGEAIVDDDGFTLVTRGGAYGATLGGGAGVASRKFQLDANSGKGLGTEMKKRKKKEKPDFYTFQVREQKRKGAFTLRLSLAEIRRSLLIMAIFRLYGFAEKVRRRQGQDLQTQRVSAFQTLLIC